MELIRNFVEEFRTNLFNIDLLSNLVAKNPDVFKGEILYPHLNAENLLCCYTAKVNGYPEDIITRYFTKVPCELYNLVVTAISIKQTQFLELLDSLPQHPSSIQNHMLTRWFEVLERRNLANRLFDFIPILVVLLQSNVINEPSITMTIELYVKFGNEANLTASQINTLDIVRRACELIGYNYNDFELGLDKNRVRLKMSNFVDCIAKRIGLNTTPLRYNNMPMTKSIANYILNGLDMKSYINMNLKEHELYDIAKSMCDNLVDYISEDPLYEFVSRYVPILDE